MKLDIIHVKKTTVECAGVKELKGKEASSYLKGHPKVYLYVDDKAKCPYCGKIFVLDK